MWAMIAVIACLQGGCAVAAYDIPLRAAPTAELPIRLHMRSGKRIGDLSRRQARALRQAVAYLNCELNYTAFAFVHRRSKAQYVVHTAHLDQYYAVVNFQMRTLALDTKHRKRRIVWWQSVLTHELLHILGLLHTQEEGSIMNANIGMIPGDSHLHPLYIDDTVRSAVWSNYIWMRFLGQPRFSCRDFAASMVRR